MKGALRVVFTCLLGLSFLLLPKTVMARSMIIPWANNTICPVTKSEITYRRFNTDYDGKRYWFSSYSAVVKFKEDPARYIRELEELTSPTRETPRTFRQR